MISTSPIKSSFTMKATIHIPCIKQFEKPLIMKKVWFSEQVFANWFALPKKMPVCTLTVSCPMSVSTLAHAPISSNMFVISET